MKKYKITLVIPEWMIEPKNVYRYMSATGISDEEKEDTLIKRLDKLLENTDYKWSLEEKMVPDSERTMLYNTRLMCGVFVTCVNELDNKFYYTKLEALAEAYKAIYNFKKEGYLKFNKDDENVPKPLDNVSKYDSSLPLGVTSLEDLLNWSKSTGFKFESTEPENLNIGRGFTKPVFETCNKEELLFLIENEMIDGSSYQVLQATNEEGTDTYYNIEYNVDDEKTDAKEILHTWSKSEYEALSNFYTYLRENKKDKK